MDFDNTEREMLKEFEKAHAIAQLLQHPGYKYIVEILEKEMLADEYRVLNLPIGAEADLVRICQIAARLSRSKYEQLQLRLRAAVDAVSSLQPTEY